VKAMILAAGYGTRMRPLSELVAKAALPVLNRPLVHWTLESLARVGVREVAINLHHRAASVMRAAGDGSAFGLRVRYSRERRILGSIGGVRRMRAFLGDEPFLLLNGDMVFDLDIRRLIARHRESGARATVSLQPHPPRGRYGSVVTDARGRIRSFGGHPPPGRGRAWHFTGIQVMDPAILDRLETGYAETARDLYAPLIQEGELLLGVPLRGPWYDLSSPSLYLASQGALLARGFGGARSRLVAPDADVAASARVSRSVVGRRARVGAGARVSGSVLWEDAVVGEGARVEGSILAQRVVIPAGASVRGQIVLRRSRFTAGLPGLRDDQHWSKVDA
jgi:mannose-1-phosphate guanylyltransferase